MNLLERAFRFAEQALLGGAVPDEEFVEDAEALVPVLARTRRRLADDLQHLVEIYRDVRGRYALAQADFDQLHYVQNTLVPRLVEEGQGGLADLFERLHAVVQDAVEEDRLRGGVRYRRETYSDRPRMFSEPRRRAHHQRRRTR